MPPPLWGDIDNYLNFKKMYRKFALKQYKTSIIYVQEYCQMQQKQTNNYCEHILVRIIKDTPGIKVPPKLVMCYRQLRGKSELEWDISGLMQLEA